MATTTNDYLKAIKARYEIEKAKTYAAFLTDPSPAKLRDYCLLLLEAGMPTSDQKQMALFFKPKPEETLDKCIAGIDTEKLKPIKDFMIGKTQQTNSVNLELIAILVHYQPRPYQKFLHRSKIESNDDEKEVDDFDFSEEGRYKEEAEEDSFVSSESKSKRSMLMIALLVISFFSVGYVAKDFYFPTKGCMQWQENHYEVVDCDVNGLVSISPVVGLDEDLLEFRKVELKKGMTFFKYKKPLYYYYKVSRDSVEFFNAPGLHPITNEPLKKITWHMIEKYVK
ncbi:MAG: hypothetical protein EOO46_07720 [Flavobacterium sp.]|nr:MAG: hypothetical protein EOO46_07720 [Flavobacterium sp.]